jgi:hypothetical protein
MLKAILHGGVRDGDQVVVPETPPPTITVMATAHDPHGTWPATSDYKLYERDTEVVHYVTTA